MQKKAAYSILYVSDLGKFSFIVADLRAQSGTENTDVQNQSACLIKKYIGNIGLSFLLPK